MTPASHRATRATHAVKVPPIETADDLVAAKNAIGCLRVASLSENLDDLWSPLTS